ncbi:hypothetical protein [Shewanella aegiceratis]|uniref:hypothetical protein n=1 Tax=Shewanella aegiceratis TaxID=2864203 RepID=UPI001C65F44A|nr:hypothetical protein [Shewanella aegiceratis]QYJ81862.1 hypothetical protein K0H80_16420 [Shewanella aegiceratis]
MKIRDGFEKLDLHDASIERIERLGGDIILEIKGVYILKGHPMSQGNDLYVEGCELKILGVISEEAKFWEDNVSPKAHPEPDFPIDEIMHATYENGIFHLDGFKNRTPWYEWFIHAKGFELDVHAFKRVGT